MRKSGVKAVGKVLVARGKVVRLYTCCVVSCCRVHKTSDLYTAVGVFLQTLSHNLNVVFQSVLSIFLPSIHTTYNDNKKLIYLFSYY